MLSQTACSPNAVFCSIFSPLLWQMFCSTSCCFSKYPTDRKAVTKSELVIFVGKYGMQSFFSMNGMQPAKLPSGMIIAQTFNHLGELLNPPSQRPKPTAVARYTFFRSSRRSCFRSVVYVIDDRTWRTCANSIK